MARSSVGVVVDGYSSGSLYREALEKRGYEVVHVQSRPDMPSKYRATVDDAYHAKLIFDGNLETLFRELSKFDVRVVIPGTDPGVILTAEIAARFKLPDNSVATAKLLRNKFNVNETCRRKGLRIGQQCLTGEWKEAEAWAIAHGKLPIIAKPVGGNGSHAVCLASTLPEFKEVFHSLRNSNDVVGDPNEQVLIQEFLKGEEFFVDTVTSEGTHYVTDVFRYAKIESHSSTGANIYDYDELIAPEDAKPIIDYALSALDAVGYKFGAAHVEVMKTNAGPALVEINARIVGGNIPKLINLSTDCDPIAMSIDAILDPKTLEKRSRLYQMKKHARFVSLISHHTGVVRNCPYADTIQKLPSCVEMRLASPGTSLIPTRDLTTVAGSVFLAHADRRVVESDYKQIREWESKGLFELTKP